MSANRLRSAELDVCLVATRRPDLLAQTLSTFEEGLFRHFRVTRIIANVDPLFGTAKEQRECVALIRRYDPDASITQPGGAGFAAAVARTWAASTADIILHLEDDWLLKRPVHPADLEAMVRDRRVGQVSFNHAGKDWSQRRKGRFCYTRGRRYTAFGVRLPFKHRVPLFLTAPSFFAGDFARHAAQLMNPNFDPEKQFCRGLNPLLESYVLPFKNLILGENPDFYIEDIGRAWRERRGIVKHLVDGQSSWEETSSTEIETSGVSLNLQAGFDVELETLMDSSIASPDQAVVPPVSPHH